MTELLVIIAALSKAAEIAAQAHAQNRDPTAEEMESVNTQYRAAMDGLLERTKPRED